MNVIIQKEKLEDVAASIREIGENENVDITIDPFPASEFGQQISGLDYMIPTAKTAESLPARQPDDITLEIEFTGNTLFINPKTYRATKIYKKVRNLMFHTSTTSSTMGSMINNTTKNNYFVNISRLKTVFIPANMNVSSSAEFFAPFQVPNDTREGMEIYTEEISKPASWGSTFEEVGIKNAGTQQQEILYATIHYGVTKEEYLDIINSKHQY